MKQTIFFLLLSSCISALAMDHTEYKIEKEFTLARDKLKIEKEVTQFPDGGGSIKYYLKEANPPTLSLFLCYNCDNECSTKCGSCKGVYYCSKDHQKSDWSRHKKECSIIKKAHNGNIQQMRNFFYASIATALKHKNLINKAANSAGTWTMRTWLRAKQDVACLTDQTVIDAPIHIFLEHIKQLKQLKSEEFDPVKMMEDPTLKTNAIKWIEDLMNTYDLDAPYGIRQYDSTLLIEQTAKSPYGLDFLKEKFKDKNSWKQIRQDILANEINIKEVIVQNGESNNNWTLEVIVQ